MQFIGRGRTVGRSASAWMRSTRALGQPGISARPDRRDPLPDHRSIRKNRRRSIMVSGHRRNAGRSVCAWWRNTRTGVSPIASSISRGRIARSCLRQINATEADAQLYGRLASSIIYANASLRADAALLNKNRRGQSGLWGYAISGDLPIVLLQIGDAANIDLVRQLVQAHAYWRLKGLAVDLVIWNEDHAGYRQLLHEQIMGLIAAGVEAHVIDRPGGIFVTPAEQMSNEDRILLQSVARAIITDSRGRWRTRSIASRPAGELRPTASSRPERIAVEPRCHRRAAPRSAVFQWARRIHYGWARVCHHDGARTGDAGAVGQCVGEPALWHRRLRERSRLHVERERPRVPPHALAQRPRDAIRAERPSYLRDEESGHFWSPTPLPSRGAKPYVSRHGFGYSVFEHTEDGISSELWVYVALDASVKFTVLKIRNDSGRSRRLSATGYVEWVLGDLRPKSAHACRDRDRPEQRRALRAESIQHRLPRPDRLLRCR